MKKYEKKIECIVYRKGPNGVEILSIKRAKDDGGFWQPVTGTIEEGENLLNGLKRELLEEIGINEFINISDVIYEFSWSNEKKDCDEYVFTAEIPFETKIILSEEHEDYKWIPINEAEYPMPENNKALQIFREKL